MTKILIAAPPGYFRNSLTALVRTLSQTQIRVSNDNLPAILEAANCFFPDILVIDGNALDLAWRLRDKLPGCKLLFMVDHISREAIERKAGKEVILSRSVSMGELLAALGSLTPEVHPAELEPAYGFA